MSEKVRVSVTLEPKIYAYIAGAAEANNCSLAEIIEHITLLVDDYCQDDYMIDRWRKSPEFSGFYAQE
jgi:hypothetical protein